MPSQSWVGTLITSKGDGPALANSAVATSLLATGDVYTLPANTIYFVGQKFRVRAWGRVSTLAAGGATLILDIRLGAVVACASQAMATNATAQTNQTWMLDAELTVRTYGGGTATTMIMCGRWESRAVLGAVAVGTGGTSSLLIPETAPTPGTGFDATAAQAVNMFGTWSVANASYSIQCQQFSLEQLN